MISGVQEPRAAPGLKRTLGLWQLTVSGVGIVIGAGIYVLIGEAANEAGNALWVAFVLAALLAALTGLSYAELAGMFPQAGAEYGFARNAFNEFTGFLTGWMMIAANLIAAAAVSTGFGHYLRHFVDIDVRIGALGLLAILTLIVISGVQRSIWLSVGLVTLQVGGLVLVIVAGAPHLGDQSLVEGATVPGIVAAAALIFFAFIGFDEVVTLSEETRDAARVVPRALLLALGISTLLYLLVGIAAVSTVGGAALAGSERPLALVVEHAVGSSASDVIAFIALASTMNTTLLVLTAASRLTFGMARDGQLPRSLSKVARWSNAPYAAALVGLAVAASFAFSGDIGLVASVTDFAVYAIFIVVNLSVVALRYRDPLRGRPFQVPWALGRLPLLPLLAIATVLLMVVGLRPAAWALGVAAIASGLAAWLLIGPRRRT